MILLLPIQDNQLCPASSSDEVVMISQEVIWRFYEIRQLLLPYHPRVDRGYSPPSRHLQIAYKKYIGWKYITAL